MTNCQIACPNCGATLDLTAVVKPPPPSADINIVFVGNSMLTTMGGGVAVPEIVHAQLGNAGVNADVHSLAGGGYTLTRTGGVIPGTVLSMMPDASALRAAGAINILVIWELINELYQGATPAEAMAALQVVIAALVGQWTVLVVMPTPRDHAGVPATYEADRQTLIGLLEQMQGVTLVRVDQDPRLSSLGAYYADGVHFTPVGKSVAARVVVDAIRDVCSLPDSVHYAPGALVWLASDGVLDESGQVASEGNPVAAWEAASDPSVQIEQVTGALRPVRLASSLSAGGKVLSSQSALEASARHTMLARVKATSAGWLFVHDGLTNVRMNLADGAGSFCGYVHTPSNNQGSLVRVPTAGSLVDGAWHTMGQVYAGTHASHAIWKDGTKLPVETYTTEGGTTYNHDVSGEGQATMHLLGTDSSNGFAGEIAGLVYSVVPFTDDEVARFSSLLAGVT